MVSCVLTVVVSIVLGGGSFDKHGALKVVCRYCGTVGLSVGCT